MKPAMCVVELQHKTHLLIVSETSSISSTGLDSGEEIGVRRQRYLGQIIAITGTGFD